MKNNSFNKAIDKYLKEFLNTPSDDLKYLEKFYTTPQIDMTNYHEWRIFSTPIFGIHYYSSQSELSVSHISPATGNRHQEQARLPAS